LDCGAQLLNAAINLSCSFAARTWKPASVSANQITMCKSFVVALINAHLLTPTIRGVVGGNRYTRQLLSFSGAVPVADFSRF
jgi:hypothetical protein